jgi:hypothetical protein
VVVAFVLETAAGCQLVANLTRSLWTKKQWDVRCVSGSYRVDLCEVRETLLHKVAWGFSWWRP